MSKRGADEYITKEHGSVPNQQDESKVKMATAAQLAKRKMAAPKGRLNRTPAGASASPSNPFGSATFGSTQQQQPPQQTFGAVGNGLSFGQTQSFPPGTSSSGGGFNFSVPAQSSSFTFGQPVQNNPFASLNGGTGQEANKGVEDTVMESPQKKPAFSAGVFGTSQNSGSTGMGLFQGFGASTATTQPPSSTPFGQPQSSGFGVGSGTSLFGQTQTPPTEKSDKLGTQSTGLFGQSTAAKTTPDTPAATNGVFGASQQPAPSFSFGKSISEAPKNAFSFGQTQTSTPSTDTAIVSPPLFGQSGPTEQTSYFGANSTQTPSSDTTVVTKPPTSSALFGSVQGPSTTSIFGSPAATEAKKASQPSEQPSQPTSTFGLSTTGQSNSTPAANPFAGLFRQTSQDSQNSSDNTPKPVFNFAAPAQPQGLFSAPKAPESTSASVPATATPSQSSFGFKPAETPKTSTLFSSQPSPASPAPSKPFSSSVSGSGQTDAGQSVSTPVKSAPSFTFGQSSASRPITGPEQKPLAGFSFGTPPSKESSVSASTPTTSIKTNIPSSTTAKADAPTKVDATPKNSFAFGTTTSSTHSAEQTRETLDPITPKAPTAHTTATDGTSGKAEDPTYTIFTNPPARIPPYLSAEKYKSYDSNYRLHSLNREFQKRVAVLDPTREDFENIVRVYVAARESIGESIGLYTRNVAGMKRKGDHSDDGQEGAGTAKKVKSGSDLTAQDTPSRTSFGSSIFQPVPSTAKSTGNTSGTGASTPVPQAKPSTASQPSTSTLFKSMIPEAGTSTSGLFSKSNASTPKATQPSSPAKPASLFGNYSSSGLSGFKPASTSSTTPPSSPPKKTGFQIPNFGASSGSDFMSAFKKQAEETTAKFEKEAMEKRKAEEFDSDEDDEDAWTKKYEEEQRAKKAKVAASTGFVPNFASTTTASNNVSAGKPVEPTGNNVGDQATDESEENDTDNEGDDEAIDGEDQPEGEADNEDGESDDEGSTASQPLQTNGKSLFDRVSRASTLAEEKTPKSDSVSAVNNNQSLFANAKATPEAPSFSPITPMSTAAYKPATTFNFSPTPRDSPTPTFGASVFDGGFTRDGPIPGEGLFGSRSNTPVNGEKPKANIFGSLGTSQSAAGDDHTWKKGSGIKFGTESDAPAVNITAPSPVRETNKFGTLFGTGSSAPNGNSASGTLGFSFGGSTSAPAPGFLGAVSYLAPGSGTPSGVSSRATSPGGTDNESVATNESEDVQSDPQSTLLAHTGPYPGEENEDILFEARAKIHRNYKEDEIEGTKKQKGWNVEGIGPMRVLKNKETGKTRIVARAEPNANVVLNANLTPGVAYKANTSTVIIPVFGGSSPVQWMIKVKTPTIASELSGVLENNKSS